MKSSSYNISVPFNDNGVLVFNSFSKSFLYLSTKVWRKCFEKDSSVKLTNITVEELKILKDNGFVIEDDVDEYASVFSLKMKTRLNKRSYHIIINPTLDCNLRCWYCYESHKKGSRISQETVDAIFNHIELKYAEDKFEKLELSFFGGEPLLKAKTVCLIIERISEFCIQNNILLTISFTTNGTILPQSILSVLKDKKVTFQITLDGIKKQHNSVRGFKNVSDSNSYEIIWKNIQKLYDKIQNLHVYLRINYDDNTFKEFKSLSQQILSLDKKRLTVSLQKIWQIDSVSIDFEKVFDFINTLQDNNVNVSFLNFSKGETTCYADELNSVVINYDGSIFKCTARDFLESQRIGKLSHTGEIIWDFDKLKQYVFAQMPSKCKSCKMFPSCPGICSQKVIEEGENAQCCIMPPFTIEDYVLYNYKLNTLQSV